MTADEWTFLNAVFSQLQHFHDKDSLEAKPEVIADLLDKGQLLLEAHRPLLIRERDFGHQQSLN